MRKMSNSFWKQYEKASELEKPRIIQTLPLLHGFKHKVFDKSESLRILAQYIHAYLEDYKEYIETISDGEKKKWIKHARKKII